MSIPTPGEAPDRGSIYHTETTEFYSVSNRYTVRSDVEYPETHVSFNLSEVESEADKDRPHQQKDDSNLDPSGAKRTTIEQLCSYQSVTWASEAVGYKTENPSHELTIVSTLVTENKLFISKLSCNTLQIN